MKVLLTRAPPRFSASAKTSRALQDGQRESSGKTITMHFDRSRHIRHRMRGLLRRAPPALFGPEHKGSPISGLAI